MRSKGAGLGVILDGLCSILVNALDDARRGEQELLHVVHCELVERFARLSHLVASRVESGATGVSFIWGVIGCGGTYEVSSVVGEFQ